MHRSVAIMLQAANQYRARKLLGWDRLRFNTYQFETGLLYLDLIEAPWVSKVPEFWNWWRNHWDAIDQDFINQAKELPEGFREILYQQLHDPDTFPFYPHKAVLEIAISYYKKQAA